MAIKKIIFDLDGTLISWQDRYADAFKMALEDNHIALDYRRQSEFSANFEKNYNNISIKNGIEYFFKVYNIEITEDFFKSWLNYLGVMSEYDPVMEEFLRDLSKYYNLVVLTNWFQSSQLARLQHAKIAKYFSAVYGGDEYLKPHPNSYLLAAGSDNVRDCLMVGDSYEIDIVGALNLGMPAVLISENERVDVPTIKNVYELKKVLKKGEINGK